MRIKEITYRNRNDFHYIAECKCGHEYKRTDGYADAFYCKRVVPEQSCPKCGLNEYGKTDAEWVHILAERDRPQ